MFLLKYYQGTVVASRLLLLLLLYSAFQRMIPRDKCTKRHSNRGRSRARNARVARCFMKELNGHLAAVSRGHACEPKRLFLVSWKYINFTQTKVFVCCILACKPDDIQCSFYFRNLLVCARVVCVLAVSEINHVSKGKSGRDKAVPRSPPLVLNALSDSVDKPR